MFRRFALIKDILLASSSYYILFMVNFQNIRIGLSNLIINFFYSGFLEITIFLLVHTLVTHELDMS